MSVESPPQRCPRCDAGVAADAKFCANCGKALPDAAGLDVPAIDTDATHARLTAAARIFVMSGVGAAAVRRAWVASASIAGASAAAASGRAWPQLAQNFASAATLASHRGQRCGGDSTLMVAS